MVRITAGEMKDFPRGTVNEVQLEGRTFAIAKIDGALHAIDGICGHAGGHLGRGQLTGAVVKCPRHGSDYDMRTGKNLKKPYLPFAKAADRSKCEIIIEGEDVMIVI